MEYGPVQRQRVAGGAVIGAIGFGGLTATALAVSHGAQGPLIDGIRTISRHKTSWEIAGVMVGMTMIGAAIGAWIGATSAPVSTRKAEAQYQPYVPIDVTLSKIATAPGAWAPHTTLLDVFNAGRAQGQADTRSPLYPPTP